MDRLLEERRLKKKRYSLLEEAKKAKLAAKVLANNRPFQLEVNDRISYREKNDTGGQFACLPSFGATKPL